MKWEYRTLALDVRYSFFGKLVHTETMDEELNKYGRLGWELVNCYSIRKPNGLSSVYAVMKKSLD